MARYLEATHNAKIVVVGGVRDIEAGHIIQSGLRKENVLFLPGKLGILETLELFRRCSFLISNDTGTAHMAAAVNLPVVGLYGVRNVFGSWFPYGKNHIILHHKFFDCTYTSEDCIKKSVDSISVEEVKVACDAMIRRLV